MRRRKIPSNTNYYTYYNANPSEQVSADCVIRAVSVVESEDWYSTLMDMTIVLAESDDVFCSDSGLKTYMQRRGHTIHKQVRKYDNTKLTGIEFCKYLEENGYQNPVLAKIGAHHVTSFVRTEEGYKVYDTWNCSWEKVGIWWSKE